MNSTIVCIGSSTISTHQVLPRLPESNQNLFSDLALIFRSSLWVRQIPHNITKEAMSKKFLLILLVITHKGPFSGV